jgi:pantothenate kinase type III
MSLLVCDIGHSRLKIHLYQPELVRRWILPLKPFAWPKELTAKDISELLWMGTNQSYQLRLSSHCSQLGFPAGIQLGIDCKVPLPLAENCSFAGNDRLAQALGAQQEFPLARNCIVSAGSALVIDEIDNGTFCGGLIGLGWQYYRQTMQQINPLLVTKNISAPHYPGLNTAEAVTLGWLEGACGAIERCAKNCAHIIFTGGDAQKFLGQFPHAHYRPTLGADAMAKALGYTVSPNQTISDETLPFSK